MISYFMFKVVLDRSGIYCATSCTDKTLVFIIKINIIIAIVVIIVVINSSNVNSS